MQGIIFIVALLGPFFAVAALWALFQREMLRCHGPRAWGFLVIPIVMPILYLPILAMNLYGAPQSHMTFDPIDFVFTTLDLFGLFFMVLFQFKMFKIFKWKSLFFLIAIIPLAQAHLMLLALLSCRPEGCGL